MGDGEQRRHRLDRNAEAFGQLVVAQTLRFQVQRQLIGGRQRRPRVTVLHESDGTNPASGCLA